MKTFFILISAVLFLLSSSISLSQQNYTIDVPGTRSFIYYSGGRYDDGYGGSLPVGQHPQLAAIYRSYITWSNIMNYIPEGAEITEVKFFITWGGNGSTLAQIEFREFEYVSGNFEQLWLNIESGILWDTKPATTTEYSFPELTEWVLNIVNGSGVDPIRVGIKNQDESNSDYFVNYSSAVNLRISYTITTTVTQVDELSNPFGQVGLWLGNDWNYINVPFGLDLQAGTNLGLQSDTNFKAGTNQKYWEWSHNSEVSFTNHHNFTIQSGVNEVTSTFKTANEVTISNSLEGTSIDNGNVEFADPWLIDYPDPLFNYTKRNRGMKQTGDDALIFYQRQSPFDPDYDNYYKGVFLNRDYNIPGDPYYKVGMPTEQTISINGQQRNFFPYKWRNDGGATFQDEYARQTGVVFTDDEATATAVLKGQLMSNDQNGISSGSQRKLVRTDNGIYHIVYESMGHVWYTHSLTGNFYGQWRQEIYLSEAIGNLGENPAVDFEGNKVKIVFEADLGDEAAIYLFTFIPDVNGSYIFSESEEVLSYPLSYFGSARPAIAYTSVVVFIAYRKNSSDGLNQKSKILIGGNWQWKDEDPIPNTSSYSCNPSTDGISNNIHLVYQHSLGVRYILAVFDNYGADYTNYAIISTGSGYTNNYSPSISLAKNDYPVVSWIGYTDSGGGGINKVDGDEASVSKVVVRRGISGSWSSFFKAGNNAATTNNNSSNTTVSEQSVITWSEGTSPNYNSKWVRRVDGNYTDAQSLSHSGKQNQVSNGTNLENIKGTIFSTTSSPFVLSLSTTNFNQQFGGGGITKVGKFIELSYGREGVIYKNGVEFLFNIGDIIVGDSVIKFIEQPDTILYSTAEELNSVVKTVPFYLSPSTEFYFTDFYYVLNDSLADTALTANDMVNFKVELVKEQTGQVVGTFDNITYTKEYLYKYANVSYQVSCSNISPGDYYLRLVTTTEGSSEYFLGNVQNSGEGLDKRKYTRINFDGTTHPVTYSLEQNYPNPFNPSTTIRYQIPKDGMVTLKVYDILGAEVKTLVNEEKIAGKYEVNFNASSLASGIYIYRLNVNDPSTSSGQGFMQVRKMVLVK